MIDTTQDGCAGPAATGMGGSCSSGGSGSPGTCGGSGSSHGLVGPASASRAASPAVIRGTLGCWTVVKSSPQDIDVFCKAIAKAQPAGQVTSVHKKQRGHTRQPSWRKQRARATTTQKIFPVTERVRQLPGQGFMVSHGKVFRQLFAEELSNDKDTCKFHIGQSVIIVYLIVANLDRQTSTILSWRSGR